MKATVTSMTGFEDAIVSMFLSKRTWTPELDNEIRETCRSVLNKDGGIISFNSGTDERPAFGQRALLSSYDLQLFNHRKNQFDEWMRMLLKMGKHHITVLKFIDIAIMTEGLHRAGQDDVDAHAVRFNNRIIRNSTRLATFEQDEFSDYYKDKVLSTEAALEIAGIMVPDQISYNGDIYIKSTGGYVKEEYKDNKDVKRGLYPLGIPSNFIGKINLTEWGHVFQQRNKDGGANPEVKEWAEQVTKQITTLHPQITRDFILSIEN